MMDKPSQRAAGASPAPDALLAQAAIANATALARAGRYAEAEELLSSTAGARVAALDLLARIRAQQGRLTEAAELWSKAAAADPDEPAYPLALRRIGALARRHVWLPSVAQGLFALVVLGLVALLAAFMARRTADLHQDLRAQLASEVERGTRAQAAQLSASQEEADKALNAKLARLAAEQEGLARKQEAATAALSTAHAAATADLRARIEKAGAAPGDGGTPAAIKAIQAELAKATAAADLRARAAAEQLDKQARDTKAAVDAAVAAVRGELGKSNADLADRVAKQAEKTKETIEAGGAAVQAKLAEAAKANAARADQLAAELAGLKAAQDQLARRLERRPPDLKLDLPGITAATEGHKVILRFPEGLFGARGFLADKRASLTPAAGELLAKLGQQLQPHAGRINVEVVGLAGARECGDAIEPARAREALARQRAEVVACHLTRASRLPASALAIEAGGAHLNPCPDDTSGNRARNRTVLLYISEAPK